MFSLAEGYADLPVTVPCGRCHGCRLERSRQWAVRIMHEASLHEENSFVTLTYSPEHLPPYGSLDRRAFPNFMRRLRREFPGQTVRYFHCGEYGGESLRPHYHCCLFGVCFRDQYLFTTRGGFPVCRSETLERLWPYGLSEIGSLTFESAAYVARYVMKKVSGDEQLQDQAYGFADEDGVWRRVEPEYATMSRRPGIGSAWLDQYGDEVYRDDGVLCGDRLAKPPRYYDDRYAVDHGEAMALVRRARAKRRRAEEETPERLAVREAVAKAKAKLFQPRKGV